MNNDASWAEEEFGDADLGDVRRTARLVQLASVLGAQPSASLPAAMPDWADLKAAYRFFDNDCVHAEAVLESHLQATVRRLQAVPLALAVQDTTYLDWTDHTATTGLGPLATPTHQGLLAHTTLALTPEHVPLGLLQQQTWARDAAVHRQGDHKDRAITEKESEKWLTSLQAVVALQAQCPQTHFVSVGDREADLYELFLVERPSTVDLLCGPLRIAERTPPNALCGQRWPQHRWRRRSRSRSVPVLGSRRARRCWKSAGGRSRCGAPANAKPKTNHPRAQCGVSGPMSPTRPQAPRRSNGCC